MDPPKVSRHVVISPKGQKLIPGRGFPPERRGLVEWNARPVTVLPHDQICDSRIREIVGGDASFPIALCTRILSAVSGLLQNRYRNIVVKNFYIVLKEFVKIGGKKIYRRFGILGIFQ